MRKLILLVGAASLALPGCTTLRVHNFTTNDAKSRQGIAYFLPFTQFDTKLSWTASCDKNDGNALGLTPKAEMVQKTGPDPDGLYVIDYESLDAFTKTSNVKVEFYDNGAIKSINASADDRTGEILQTTLTAVGTLVRATALGASSNQPKEATLVCSKELLEALAEFKKAKSGERDGNGNLIADGVDQKTDKLKAATDSLEAYSAVIVRAGESITDAQKAEHFRRIAEVSAAQIELNIATKKLAEAQKRVTYTRTITFPATSNIFESAQGEEIDAKVLANWIGEEVTTACAKKPQADRAACAASMKVEAENAVSRLARENSLWLSLAARATYAGKFTGGEKGDAESGVRYRISVPATLSVCKAASCTARGTAGTPGDGGADKASVLESFPVQMMNAGTTFFLPFKSAAFTNATLSATFAQNGVLTSAGYEQKRAQGQALADATATLLGQIGTTVEQARKSKKSELDKTKEEEALAKAQKALADARAALVPKEVDPTDAAIDALSADTALRAAEVANRNAAIAKIEAEKRYAEALKPK